MTEPKHRNFSPWAYWMLRLEANTPSDPCPVDRPEDMTAWRARAHGRLIALLGRQPERVPLGLELRDSTDCGSYTRESIVFDSEPGMSVPAFLLVPHERDAPGPAVLAQHGHGPGKSEVCGLDDEASRAAITEHNGDYGHQLAERGYVVLALDLRCFGERADWAPPDKYPCDLNLVHAYAAGLNPLAQNLWDLARALDVLEQHPLVDPGRIGMVGLSYGGTMTLFLAAWDERVRAAVVSGYFNAWRDAHRVPWNLCGSQVLPGMLGELDHVDLGGLVAPRPLLVETGTDDLIFPLDPARREVARLSTVYETFGVPDLLEHDVFEGGHEWHGEMAYPFLAHHLGAGR
ncbi:MAG: alpha/beta fold hydrolase [Acidimicrobiia bacterium]